MRDDNNELYASTCEPGIVPITRYMNEDKFMIAEILHPTVPMVTQKMQYDQALSANNPDKKTIMKEQDWQCRYDKLLHDPRGADTPDSLSQH